MAERSVTSSEPREPRKFVASLRYAGKAVSVRIFKLALLRKFTPAFRCTFQSSPSALIMPFPEMVRVCCVSENGLQELTKQVPNPCLDKSSFAKDPLIFEHILQVLRVIDNNTGRQCRNRYLKCLETEMTLAFHEPRKEFFTWLKEDKSISNEWYLIQRSP